MKKGCVGCLTVVAMVCLALIGLFFYLAPRYGVTIVRPSPVQYAESALYRMHFGLYADEEFHKAEETVRGQWSQMKRYEDTYPLLKDLAQKAGGKHSHFYTPEEVKVLRKRKSELPEVRREGEFLLLTLPSFSGNEKQAAAYIDKIAGVIAQDVKGIIVDVRHNSGGRLDAMAAGFDVWLRDKTLFEIVYSEQQSSKVSLENLREIKGTTKNRKEVPIAILMSAETASSAEILILALQQLPQVRTFGQATAGYTTSNMSYPMYDGAELVLSTGRIKDSTGRIYENHPLEPDVETQSPLEDAKQWLQEVAGN
ncbi:S41 family peptidase [Streptococcus himalayensis]|uniref:Peptidase S41 n=1 Tax=Streptococcus himalayensis TaxID=1888195 RepID=A0A917A7V4_9STRE|nr:S41 family peptidase [Streptococcus himalayensis]GGE31854.1 peptidase S41 [Streptococcus himalayensis]